MLDGRSCLKSETQRHVCLQNNQNQTKLSNNTTIVLCVQCLNYILRHKAKSQDRRARATLTEDTYNDLEDLLIPKMTKEDDLKLKAFLQKEGQTTSTQPQLPQRRRLLV